MMKFQPSMFDFLSPNVHETGTAVNLIEYDFECTYLYRVPLDVMTNFHCVRGDVRYIAFFVALSYT